MDFLGRAQTFVRVAEAGSLSGAARSLRLSLAATSRQIASLEEELGAQLFARTTRSLRLTDAGRRFHDHATRLVREAEAARASVRTDRAVSGRVVVSASVTLGVLRIVPALPALLDAHRGLEVALRLEDRAVEVVSEGIDLAVRAGLVLPDTSRLVAHPIATLERVIVAAPAYLRKHGTPRRADALAGHAAVVGTAAGNTWRVEEKGELRSVAITPRVRVDTLLGIRAAVRAGLGLAVLPRFVVDEDLEAQTLKRVLPELGLAPVQAHAIQRIEARGSPRLDAVIAHLKATVPFPGKGP
jgi:DNA-binding transcriptional LysR family regulator